MPKRSRAGSSLESALKLLVLALLPAGACDTDDEKADVGATGGTSGAGGSPGGNMSGGSSGALAGTPGSGGTAGSAGAGVVGGNGGQAGSNAGGAGTSGVGGEGGDGGEGGSPDGDCGNPDDQGVVIFEDVSEDTTWSCAKYTLTRPIFVRSSGAARTTLTISAGVTVVGVQGDLDAARLPGALVVTRTGRLSAVGTSDAPIVFTSAEPVGSRSPGDWGGVVLLGRASTNVPANYENSGNVAGEMFIEGLPRTELATYGRPMGGDGEGGAGGMGSDPPEATDWDCGRLEYARIEFAGFEVAPQRELNGLTLGGCGRGTVVDRVQVHLGSDDGVEVFGGTVDLRRVVITGAKDDSLDWDQGWRGRAQFIAIQMHDDTALAAIDRGDSGIEADGYADPALRFGVPSGPRIFNMTLVASVSAGRGIRLREGTEGVIRNALILAPTGGVASGIVDLGDAITADWITAGNLSIQNSVFFDRWPSSGQADSLGTLYTEADYFRTGPGAVGNDVLADLTLVLPTGQNQTAPGWVPANTSPAAMNGIAPSEVGGAPPFFDTTAVYRGAFPPAGANWAAGWTAYPVN